MTRNPLQAATWVAMTTLEGAGEAGARAYALSDALDEIYPAPTGVGVFEIDEASGLWEVGAYFTERPDETALALLAAAFDAKPFAVSMLEDRDWVAQVRRELTPVEAGRFFVYGGHDEHRVPPSALGLRIEAAMAFGTGHHGTTRGCLLAMHRLAQGGFRPWNVADIGCGTGVLAMGAAKLWRVPCIATDIDPTASATARENARANGLTPEIFTGTAIGFQHEMYRRRAPFDLIVANILAGPLKRLAPEIARHVTPGGYVILSGILNRQATGVERVYAGWGLMRAERRELGEWTTLTLRSV